MTAQSGAEALERLEALGDRVRAAEMAAYHKVPRRYLGVPVPEVEALVAEWRADASVEERVALASALWVTDVHEARVAAAKLLTQARIRPDDEPVWRLIVSWVPTFDAWALADHASVAGQKRLVADPRRLDEVEGWVASDHLWTRRAALVMTLPWTRDRFAKPPDLERRERVLGWCETLADDQDWFIQKAIAWWLRDLSKRDPDRVRIWLDAHGERLKRFARKEAARQLPT
jgi:3-methyladenine DNA glycosylase AlkD